jgi:carbon storage regulator
MLVLSRKLDEVIVIDGTIQIRVVDIRGSHVRLGIDAPSHVEVFRQELWLKKQKDAPALGRCAAVLE